MSTSRAAPATRRFGGANGRAYIRVSDKVASLIAGDSDLGDWDDEELLRGQARDKGGQFRGQPPSLVPREVYAEWARRQMESGFADLLGGLRDVMQAVLQIALDPEEPSSVRLQASNMVMERMLGKARERLDIGVQQAEPYEQIITSVTIRRDLDEEDDPELDDGIVDAEIVEDDEFTFDEDDEFGDVTHDQVWTGGD